MGFKINAFFCQPFKNMHNTSSYFCVFFTNECHCNVSNDVQLKSKVGYIMHTAKAPYSTIGGLDTAQCGETWIVKSADFNAAVCFLVFMTSMVINWEVGLQPTAALLLTGCFTVLTGSRAAMQWWCCCTVYSGMLRCSGGIVQCTAVCFGGAVLQCSYVSRL